MAEIALIGVPSSAGAHWPGQEKAPQFLRDAGLVESLQESGISVRDLGDLPRVRFRPDPENRQLQNLQAVFSVARLVEKQTLIALQHEAIPLVIGGDCTIALGVLAAFVCVYDDVGVLYFDGHTDLNTPTTSRSGILDSMGVAHMIGEPGVAGELSGIGPRFPLLPKNKLVLFGYNPNEINDCEYESLVRNNLTRYSTFEIQHDAAAIATKARSQLEQRAERFIVHFDVDVIDFSDFPVADVPQSNGGLSFNDALACLGIFVSSPKFAGLSIAEINPDHADEDAGVARRFVKGLATTLAKTRSRELVLTQASSRC